MPTAGWLLKKGGRKTGRYLTRWKKRWFVFDPRAKELRYLEGPASNKAKGTIAIVPGISDVFVPEAAKTFCFCVSSLEHGAQGGAKISTLLQCADADDLHSWLKVLRAALPAPAAPKPRRMSSLATVATRGPAMGAMGGDAKALKAQRASTVARKSLYSANPRLVEVAGEL